jgi:hypothetical protein
VTGHLDDTLTALLARELPSLFGGAAPLVQATVKAELFELDPSSVDAQASEPRADDRIDDLPFDAARPDGPYVLSQVPDPGPRKVRLTTVQGDRIALASHEVQFDAARPDRFTLALREGRDLTGVTGVQVLYGITSVFTKLKYGQDLTLQLQAADAAAADRAAALAVAAIALNRPQLITAGAETLSEGNYGVQIEIKVLHLVKGTAPLTNTRLLQFRAEIELKATRALAADEGKPIRRISSVGVPVDARRPVDIRVDVDA